MTKRKNILVVDDEPCVRDICVQYLGMAGYEVDAFASGEEALEAVARHSYDLLILDLSLHGMNGLTTFNRLREIAPEMKAVVVSGSMVPFESELAEARRNGLLGVLAKPFDLLDLSVLVDSAMDGGMRAA
jgi:CheY-like chemotaxis protein